MPVEAPVGTGFPVPDPDVLDYIESSYYLHERECCSTTVARQMFEPLPDHYCEVLFIDRYGEIIYRSHYECGPGGDRATWTDPPSHYDLDGTQWDA